MKNLKFIYLAFILAMFTLVSCDNNDPIVDQENPNQSASARTSMSELKSHFNTNGQLRTDNNPTNNVLFDFCFDFQYPVTFTYNTGVNVTVNNFDALVDVLVAMTDSLYIDGIVFPFNVEVFDDATNTVIVQAVNNELEFITLIESCGFDDDDCVCTQEYVPVCVEVEDVNGEEFTVEYPNMCSAACDGFTQQDLTDCEDFTPGDDDNDCFEFNYPISITNSNGSTIVINGDDEWNNILFATNAYDFVYPFDVTLLEGNVVSTITSADDFETLLDTCYEDDPCDCPTVNDPVCILITTPNGDHIEEFDNMCEAECAGYTQNDVVDCNTSNDCVENFTITVGECIDETSYTVTFNFIANGYDGDFTLYTRNNVMLTTSSMSNLPLTLTMPLSGFDEDYIKVILDSTVPCDYEEEWFAPDCNTTLPCWDFVYPVSFNHNGSTITVNDRTSFDNDFDSNTDTLVYPFNVIINNVTSTINTPNGFFVIGEFDRMCE